MPIQFSCPACAKKFRVAEAHAGKMTTCPGCKGKIRVPEPSGAVADAGLPTVTLAPEAEAPPPGGAIAAVEVAPVDGPKPPRVRWVSGNAPFPTNHMGLAVTSRELLVVTGPMTRFGVVFFTLLFGFLLLFCFPVFLVCIIGMWVERRRGRDAWRAFVARAWDELRDKKGVRVYPLSALSDVAYNPRNGELWVRLTVRQIRLRATGEEREKLADLAEYLKPRIGP